MDHPSNQVADQNKLDVDSNDQNSSLNTNNQALQQNKCSEQFQGVANVIAYFQAVNKEAGCRGWLVIFATILVAGIVASNFGNYSLVNDKMLIVYNNTENYALLVGVIGSMYYSFEYFFALPAALLVDIFGPRIVCLVGSIIVTASMLLSSLINRIELYYVSIGLFCAFGEAAVSCSYYAILPHYFDENLGLATGLMNSGSSVITSVMPFSAAFLLDNYGLNRYYLITGLLCVLLIPASLIFKPRLKRTRFDSAKEKIKDSFQAERQQEIFLSKKVHVLKSPKFIIWIVSTAVWEYGSVMFSQTINTASSEKFPGSRDEILNSLWAAFTAIFSLIFGILVDKAKFSPIYFQTICAVIYCIVLLSIPLIPNFVLLIIAICFIGISDGIYYGVYLSVAKDTVGSSRSVNQAMGYFSTFMLLPISMGPIVAGAIYDKFKSYDYAYYHGGAACLLCALIQLFYPGGEISEFFKKKFQFKTSMKRHD